MDALTVFLRAASGRPFSFALGNDCLMWLADYVQAVRGVDCATDLRGRYSTGFGAARIISRAGGMVPLIDSLTAPFGIRRTDAPRRGDIAVVAAPEGLTGAILAGSLSAVCLGDRRLFIRPLSILTAWRV